MAENVAEAYGIGRRRQDEFAADSQRRASAAIDGGFFKEQITPVECPAKGGPVMFDADEHPRPGVTADTLARLRPAFAAEGTVTAGNSAGINDGAAAVLLTSEAFAGEAGLTTAAYLRGWVAAGVDPRMSVIGPVQAYANCWTGSASSSPTTTSSNGTRRSPHSPWPSSANSDSTPRW